MRTNTQRLLRGLGALLGTGAFSAAGLFLVPMLRAVEVGTAYTGQVSAEVQPESSPDTPIPAETAAVARTETAPPESTVITLPMKVVCIVKDNYQQN